ncbi:MAG: hypothetical protein LBQ80_00530 [Clostridium sp.]|jgi:hypothetical protein|nr:hypothetical protein [Clostridium sp.]
MQGKRLLQMLALNGGIALVNILAFSRAFFGLSFSASSPLLLAAAITVPLMSAVAFIYGNLRLLKPSEATAVIQALPDSARLADWLPRMRDAQRESPAFKGALVRLIEQAERFDRRQATIQALLLQKFRPEELSYIRFDGAVTGLEQVMCRGLRRLFSRMAAFDQGEYNRLKGMGALSQTQAQRLALYKESLEAAERTELAGDEILLKLDMLADELAKLGDEDIDGTGAAHAMEEIDALIRSAKLYGG